MATEVKTSIVAAEPPTADPDAADASGWRTALSQRVESLRAGRLVLGCLRWGVVFALVSCGYFGAAAVHSGVRYSPSDHQEILAAARAQK